MMPLLVVHEGIGIKTLGGIAVDLQVKFLEFIKIL